MYDSNENRTLKRHITETTENNQIELSETGTGFESYGYSLDGMLNFVRTSEGESTYEYYADGMRKSKTVNGQTTGFVHRTEC